MSSTESHDVTDDRPPIRGIGSILQQTPHGLWRVRMANGYEVDVHLDRSLKREGVTLAEFEEGEEVTLEFSAYDMSKGRIVERRKRQLPTN